MLTYTQAENLLRKYEQTHVLKFWNELNDAERQHLLKQIEQIDFDNLSQLIELTRQQNTTVSREMEEAPIVRLADRVDKDAAMRRLGEEALRKGKVAAFLVAGGQGSRLGFDGPKGMYPVTPVKRKSLFQLHAEKIISRARRYDTVIPWYIMTSHSNHKQTVAFFRENRYFGLRPENVFFFRQEMLPAVDEQGKLILDRKDSVFMSPNGHGGALKAMWDSGAVKDMRHRGIEHIFYFQVDNVLTRICEPEYIGYHIAAGADMSNKVVHKAYSGEKMGVICSMEGKTALVEYSDMTDEQMQATDANGGLKYWAGSIAVHMIDVAFVEKETDHGFRLPYHVAHKQIPFVDEQGRVVQPRDKNGYKFETFVFDALNHARATMTLEVERSEEFSALKNGEGLDSPETARRDMNRLYARWLRQAGYPLPADDDGATDIEISPLFADEVQALMARQHEIPPFSTPFYLE
ncbi:MAG: UDPGP type 1 family protein [Calditrichaeota bacterium]|nr:MAG: UDPGP type 1 family protein [Calditrichota bacterium]